VLVGGFYSFRLVFYAFHGKERFADANDPAVKACDAERAAQLKAEQAEQAKLAAAHDAHGSHDARGVHAPGKHDDHAHQNKHDDHAHHGKPHESPWVVTLPLVMLAIPSLCAGWIIGRFVFGDYFGTSIVVSDAHPAMVTLKAAFQGVTGMMAHAFFTLPFWFAVAGAVTAFYIYILRPDLPAMLRARWGKVVTVLMDKYGLDRFNDWFFAGGARLLGNGLWKGGDEAVIDGVLVNGSANAVGWFSTVIRKLQSGYIYNYAFAMIFGIVLLLTITLWSLAGS
jgi:NADH-quinone oxidoreductase subunit L